MTRKETVDTLIVSLEEAQGKLKQLKETDDTREMLKAARAVYDCSLPAYRNEYRQLARLYDSGSGEKEIDALLQAIQAKYLAGFQSRMKTLTEIAKPYAARNGIKVPWDIKTSPSF